jgi:TetR/AcrR family transcriptional repressor of mexJK operon
LPHRAEYCRIERGLLRVPDPLAAANHLAWLILGPPLDAAIFGADGTSGAADALYGSADMAVNVFLAAYR